MSNLSSDSLFHFTGKKKNGDPKVRGYPALKAILQGKAFKYCTQQHERLDSAWRQFSDSQNSYKISFPNDSKLVCFCDIPLALIEKHLKKYGSYGIGMSKEWAIRKGISPVRYVHQNSPGMEEIKGFLTNTIRASDSFVDYLLAENKIPSEGIKSAAKECLDNNFRFIEVLLSTLLAFCRSTEEELQGVPIEKDRAKLVDRINKGQALFKETISRVYDEREWRSVVPPGTNCGDSNMLSFDFEDIDWVIVKNNDYEKIGKLMIKTYGLQNNHVVWKKILDFDQLKKIL